MVPRQVTLDRVLDSVNESAFGIGPWHDTLELLASATRSRCGELIGLGSANTVPFNVVTGMGEEWADAFLKVDGGNPMLNPHVRAGTIAGELEVMSSEQFVTPDERRNNRFINEHCVEFDIPYTCLTPLVKLPDTLIGLAVIRSRSQGEIDDAQRRLFASVAPYFRAGVRAQIALEHQGATLMAATLEAVSIPAFICDQHGRVRAMTPGAEALAAEATRLRVQDGTLVGTTTDETIAIAQAVRKASARLLSESTVVVGRRSTMPVILDFLVLPRTDSGFWFDPRVVVVVREQTAEPGRLPGMLRALYGLTPSEAESVGLLADGHSPAEIAARRDVSLATTRTQVKVAYAKLGVRGQTGLLALINRLR